MRTVHEIRDRIKSYRNELNEYGYDESIISKIKLLEWVLGYRDFKKVRE